MPEYRRFIAYFYEYINGKKEKNAGFAKVELRNGMWRILFHLTTDILPEPPIQVYGFARASGYLLGLPLGTMRPGRTITEEWAYRADVPVGEGPYFLEDLSGLWIWSGDKRCYITVWDEEGIDTGKFVRKLPETEKIRGDVMEGSAEMPEEVREDVAESSVETPEEVREDVTESSVETPEEVREDVTESSAEIPEEVREDAAESSAEIPEEVREDVTESSVETPEEILKDATENSVETEQAALEAALGHLFGCRPSFQPFEDEEISGCIQIMPCDVLRLQQEGCRVGRSSFLQHGFYQYRHLLLGRMKDGAFVLGVPGLRNSQESYMARMLGFGQFKASHVCSCGRTFGYWYRRLEK